MKTKYLIVNLVLLCSYIKRFRKVRCSELDRNRVYSSYWCVYYNTLAPKSAWINIFLVFNIIIHIFYFHQRPMSDHITVFEMLVTLYFKFWKNTIKLFQEAWSQIINHITVKMIFTKWKTWQKRNNFKN